MAGRGGWGNGARPLVPNAGLCRWVFPEYSAYPIMGPGQSNRMRYFSLTCFEE
jgi:hypothetical protein